MKIEFKMTKEILAMMQAEDEWIRALHTWLNEHGYQYTIDMIRLAVHLGGVHPDSPIHEAIKAVKK